MAFFSSVVTVLQTLVVALSVPVLVSGELRSY